MWENFVLFVMVYHVVLAVCLILAVAHWINWGTLEAEEYLIFPENDTVVDVGRGRVGLYERQASVCSLSEI